MFIFEASPGLAETGLRSAGSEREQLSYKPGVDGLLIRNFGIIRRDFPYVFLLTTDVPWDTPVETHARFIHGLYDRAFMDRFPHEVLHFSLGSAFEPDRGFFPGPEIYSRLFDIERDDITFLWDGLLNNVSSFVQYHVLFSSQRVSLSNLKGRIERCQSRKEFDEAVFDLIDLIAYAYATMAPHLYLVARSDRVKAAVGKAFDSSLDDESPPS